MTFFDDSESIGELLLCIRSAATTTAAFESAMDDDKDAALMSSVGGSSECAWSRYSAHTRSLLANGDVREVSLILRHRLTLRARVIGGKKLGRTLGYPTANMQLPSDVVLRAGVYAVRFRRADGMLFNGVASFGRRPTVDIDGALLLETFVFDFSGDLYGEICSVSFFDYLRDELKFNGLEDLVDQIKCDEAKARALLAKVRPLSQLDETLAF